MSPKSAVLAAGAALALVAGATAQYFYPYAARSPVDIGVTVLGAFLVFAWYHLDSTEVGYRRSPWLNIAVIGIAIFGLPYYFFRSRGAKRGFIATALFLLTLVSLSVLSVVGGAVVSYGLRS